MKILTGFEAKQIALVLEPKQPNKKVLCPLCKKSYLNVQKIADSASNRFALVVGCQTCDYLTHFDCAE